MPKVLAFVDYGTVRANTAGDHCEKIRAALDYLENNLHKLSVPERVDIVARLNGLTKRSDEICSEHKKQFAAIGERELFGLFMKALIVPSERSVLDVAAIRDEMGQKWIDTHSKVSVSTAVRFSAK